MVERDIRDMMFKKGDKLTENGLTDWYWLVLGFGGDIIFLSLFTNTGNGGTWTEHRQWMTTEEAEKRFKLKVDNQPTPCEKCGRV